MKILITDYVDFPDIEKEISSPDIDVVLAGDSFSNDEIEGILVWHQVVNLAYIERFPNLRCVVRYGVGFDAIDLNELNRRKIKFANTPDYGTDEVADTSCALILYFSRGLGFYSSFVDGWQEGDRWQENVCDKLRRNKNQKIGIIGLGRIGISICRKMQTFGFDVGFFDPYVSVGIEKSLNLTRYMTLDDLYANADIISFNCPSNNETRGIISSEMLSKLKPNATLVNTARGDLAFNLEEILDWLDLNPYSECGLDVTPDEPIKWNKKIREQYERLRSEGRLLITPHTAYYTKEAYYEMRTKACTNLVNYLMGKGSLINQIS